MSVAHVKKVLKLYKMILKMHNSLPEEIKALGNTYVRDEFRRHKNCNVQEGEIFLQEWTKYAIIIAQQIGLKGKKSTEPLGKPLTKDEIDNMSDDQVQQMYQILLATKGEQNSS